MIYFDADDIVFAWDENKVIFRFAENVRRNRKLHLDAGIDSADVLVACESIQYEPNVDVGTNASV